MLNGLWKFRSCRFVLLRLLHSKSSPMEDKGQPQSSPAATLKVYDSLTRSKVEFVPLNGRKILWYSCGPTVYDASHMGHARSYITFDILRRVFTDYFNYEVLYVMNITDIDDKIIKRARHHHLFNQYVKESRSQRQLYDDISASLKIFKEKTEAELDPDKKAMYLNILSACEEVVMESERDNLSEKKNKVVLDVVRDPLSAWLDSKFGKAVTNHTIFSELSQHWEEEYHKDMAALNVKPPDVLTRVSEYVPEVVNYVTNIIDNGFGYESNGSVYFDVAKFSSSPGHRYAKLVPEAVGDSLAMAEGEGDLSTGMDKLKEKKSLNDFVLWKASKPGEPSWVSPWGLGRPGWHIECSVMACDILGAKADIHTGGVDLKFPHHDNEIAQAEACYGHNQWMSYFLHSGHLTIEGCKMSKSLKNFITIKAALQQYSWRQLRLAFLLHSWGATLDYSEQTMREAIYWEKLFNEFFLKVKDILRHQSSSVMTNTYSKFQDREKVLNNIFSDTRSAVHTALCDSIDTPTAMKLLRDLVGACNLYMADPSSPNSRLLETIATYCTRMLQVFGVIPSGRKIGFPVEEAAVGSEVDVEETVLPFATLIADFREEVRSVALQEKSLTLLKECDDIRDNKLPELGVLLEDKEERTVVKYVGKEEALKAKEKDKQLLEEKQRIKAEQKKKQDEAQLAREAAAAIPPEVMFRKQTDKFSKFGGDGIPTHDAQGESITDSQTKKLKKQWLAQEKKYKQFLAKQK